jgi:hypothetical protein
MTGLSTSSGDDAGSHGSSRRHRGRRGKGRGRKSLSSSEESSLPSSSVSF